MVFSGRSIIKASFKCNGCFPEQKEGQSLFTITGVAMAATQSQLVLLSQKYGCENKVAAVASCLLAGLHSRIITRSDPADSFSTQWLTEFPYACPACCCNGL